MSQPYKVLIIAPSWVGDMVMSQTLLKLLKKQYKDNVIIDILVNDWAKEVAKRMPEVNEVLLNPFKHGEFGLFKRIKLGRELSKRNYDQAFILPNSLKSAFVPFFAGIAKRTGFLGEMRYGFLNDYYKLDKKFLPLMIDRFCALANSGQKESNIEYPLFTVDKVNQRNICAKLELDLSKPVVCLCPAAEYGPAKRWGVGSFAKLADKLQVAGYQVWLMGSPKDIEITSAIFEQSEVKNALFDLAGKTNLIDVIDLLACSSSVVSNDSGLMHVACAVNVPVVAIYGSSSPGFTPPLNTRAKILQHKIECSPCFERTCKFGHYNCLAQISVDQVFNAIIDNNISSENSLV